MELVIWPWPWVPAQKARTMLSMSLKRVRTVRQSSAMMSPAGLIAVGFGGISW